MHSPHDRTGILLVLAMFLLLGWAFLAGCDGGTHVTDDDDDAGDDDVGDDDTGDDDSADQTPPSPPQVDDPVSPTYLSASTLRGSAEPAAVVKVRGVLGESETPADPASGEFCLQVPLASESVNVLRARAVDAAGNQSEETQVMVVQVPYEDLSNTALGKDADASSTQGNDPNLAPPNAVDGDMGTEWQSSDTVENPQWLRVNLGMYTAVEEVRIHWIGTSYAEMYSIKIYQDEYVVTPPPHSSWFTVYRNEEGDGGVDEVVFAEPIRCRWIGLELNKSAGFMPYREYRVAEFVVTGYEDTPPDSCP